MSRTVSCPNCGEPLDVPAEFAGRAVRCSECEQVFTPPADEPPPAPRPRRDPTDPPAARRPSRAAAPDWDDAPRPRRRADDWDDRPRRRKRSSHTWVIVLVLGVAGVIAVAFGGCVVGMLMIMNPTFVAYDSPDGGFSAEFPGRTVTRTDKTADGLTRTTVESTRGFPEETYFVRYVDLPRGRPKARNDEAAKDACDQLAAETPGCNVTHRLETISDGYTAYEVAFSHPDDNGATVARAIVVGNRVYVVGVRSDLDIEVDEDRVEHFLRAFKVKGANPGR